jgi:uncharacterized protein YecT (DUF1311 family)
MQHDDGGEAIPPSHRAGGAADAESVLLELSELRPAYEIDQAIQRDPAAVVYLAHHVESGRAVVVKAVRPQFLPPRDLLLRLLDESAAAAELAHRNIVGIYGVGRLGRQTLAIVEEYIPGASLRDLLLRHGPVSADAAARLLWRIADAVRYAHARGVVHGDIRPERVLIEEGTERPMLAGLGQRRLARSVGADSPYAAERASAGSDPRAEARADIHALGVLGWEMLTGTLPWAHPGVAGAGSGTPRMRPALASIRPDVPDRLARAIEGAIHSRPELRWASADHFLAALLDELPRATPHAAPRAVSPAGAQPRAATPEVAPSRVTPPTPATLAEWNAAMAPPPEETRGRGRWRAIAAGLLLVAGVGTAVAIGRDGEDDPLGGGGFGAIADTAAKRDSSVESADSGALRRGAAGAESGGESGRATSSPPGGNLEVCSSPVAANQRACLTMLIEDSDTELNDVYEALIRELRRTNGTQPGEPDPASVERLRTAQRDWIRSREAECRSRNEGSEGQFWALARIGCFRELADARRRDLESALRRLRSP